MSDILSTLARQGSPMSDSSSSTFENSSHNHMFNSLRSLRELPTWHDWARINHRHERVPTATVARGTAILTRDLMAMHIQRAPDIRSFVDCVPVASLQGTTFVGWRQKSHTWPRAEHA